MSVTATQEATFAGSFESLVAAIDELMATYVAGACRGHADNPAAATPAQQPHPVAGELCSTAGKKWSGQSVGAKAH